MTRFAIIKDGQVSNIITADPDFAAQFIPNSVPCDDSVHISDVYDSASKVFSRAPRNISKEASAQRSQIKSLLRQTDWTVDSDNLLTALQRAQWRSWRQSLRNVLRLPEQAVADFTVPEAPGSLEEN